MYVVDIMKKILTAIEIIGMLLLSCFAVTPVLGVPSGETTLYVGGTGPGNYTQIQDAINDSSDGDIIYVYHGIYSENIVVNKSIALIGESKDNTVIDGSLTGTVVTISTDRVIISGFTIQNSGSGYPYWDAGISILSPSSNNITIFGNNLTNNNWGIFLNHTSDNEIFENDIFNNIYCGVLLNDASGNLFLNNITNSENGIILSSSSQNNICNNNINSNGEGIYMYNSSDNLIHDNSILDNIAIGIEVCNLSNNNIISENDIINNGEDPFIGFGLVIYDSSNENTIYHNNFIGNKHNASDSCANIWDNGYPSGGNHWGDYTGTDENDDRIGDTQYNISNLTGITTNKDRYPLVFPFGKLPPVAGFTYTVQDNVVLFTSSSYDIDGAIASYYWEFGDGTNATGNATGLDPDHEYQGEYATFMVNLTVTDDDGYTGTYSHEVTTNDTMPPVIHSMIPEKGIYLRGKKSFMPRPIRMALIIGDITIEVNASDEGSGIKQVNFYIDSIRARGSPVGNDTEAPYTYNWTKTRLVRFFHMHVLKVEVIDNAGNSATKTMLVRRIL